MAQKKIDDIKRPGKVTPNASARPIIVTNHPMLANDPMVVGDKPDESEKSEETKLTVRTGKTIQPVSEDLKAPEKEPEAEQPAEKSAETVEEKASGEAEVKPTEETHGEKPALQSEAEAPVPDDTTLTESAKDEPEQQAAPAERDIDAAAIAAEAEADEVRQAREVELEQLIASGKYAVPINAVSRKRSRMHVIFLCLLGLILVLVLADVLLDMGAVSAPTAIPHTHFFTVH